MGDLGNNGKWFVNKGVERGLMHYRAGLNMIPLMEAYRRDPDDHLLLEIGMGAITGAIPVTLVLGFKDFRSKPPKTCPGRVKA
eukprot:6290766-Pyramimonas_sp.AAC.1